MLSARLRLPGTRNATTNEAGSDKNHGNKDQLHNLWLNMQVQYSKASLTYASDRAIALSGVAKVFSNALDDKFVIGMWKSRLRLDLLWKTSTNDTAVTASQHPAEAHRLHVPSFSWLSLSWPVSTVQQSSYLSPDAEYMKTKDFLYEIRDIRYSSNEHGLSSATQLLLEGQIFRVRLFAGRWAGERWLLEIADSSLFPDETASKTVFPDESRERLPAPGEDRDHYCMPAARIDTTVFRCFLLEALTGKSGSYRRIGIVDFYNNKYERIMKERREKGLSSLDRNLPALEFNEETSEYLICLE
jgi:hypothetical protein